MTAGVVVAPDDPRAGDVRTLLERHLGFAHANTPRSYVHALDLGALVDPSMSFFSARRDGELVGIGALRELDRHHGEVKSMHTAEAHRGAGVGRLVLDHLVAVARSRGYERVSLETGAGDAFAPARALYANAGFTSCAPFGEYGPSAHNTYMTLVLARLPVLGRE